MPCTLFVLLLVGLVVTDASIVEFPSGKDRLLQREEKDFSIEEIFRELPQLASAHHNSRARRASGDPTYTKSDLHDTNNRGLIHYSGGNSTVSCMTMPSDKS